MLEQYSHDKDNDDTEFKTNPLFDPDSDEPVSRTLYLCIFANQFVSTHQKNHRTKIPDAASLNTIVHAKLGWWAVIKDLEDSEDNEDNEESDIEEEERGHCWAKHHSKGTKKREFTQLQNYLVMWKKALDSAKKIAHCDGFL